MKKKIISIIICGVLIATNTKFAIAAENLQSQTSNLELVNTVTQITEEERILNEEKMKEANEYVANKMKTRAAYEMKIVNSVRNMIQNTWYNCGPTAAYNAINGATSIDVLSRELGTSSSGGTQFPGAWPYVLNTYRPGNAYAVARGTSYSTVSAWSSQLKNNIIYTIDKGHPVVADLHMVKGDPYYIYGGYDYMTKEVKHYVVVNGYDDLAATTPSEYRIIDSNDNSNIPVNYWTTLPKLAQSTYRLGILW